MKQDLPAFLPPSTRTLDSVNHGYDSYREAGRGGLLERRRVLAPPHAARAIDADVADGTAGIAVAAAVGHALGARIGIVVHVRRSHGRHGRHGHVDRRAGRCDAVVKRGATEVCVVVAVNPVGHNGNRVGARVVSAKVGDLGKRRVVGEARWRLSQCSFALPAQGLLLCQGLLLLAHLGSRGSSVGARLAGALAAQEVEAGAARRVGCVSVGRSGRSGQRVVVGGAVARRGWMWRLAWGGHAGLYVLAGQPEIEG